MSDPINNQDHKPIIINEMQPNAKMFQTQPIDQLQKDNIYQPDFNEQPVSNPLMHPAQAQQQNQHNPYFANDQTQQPNQYDPQFAKDQKFNPSYQGDYTQDLPLVQEEETEEEQAFVFDKPDVRMAFIRKVYLILSTQLLLTVGFGYLCMYNLQVKDFMMQYPEMIYVALGGVLISSYGIMCYETCARKVPLNFFMLFIFTACESIIVGYVVMFAKEENVLIALVMAATVVVALTLYAIFTKTDFTMCGGLLFVVGLVLIVGSTMFQFFYKDRTTTIIISAVFALFFGIYLIYDTQLIVGGRQHELSVDDYIVGALVLYMDIIEIFLNILSILENN